MNDVADILGRNLRCMSDDGIRTCRSFHYHRAKSEPHHTSRQRMSCLDNRHHVSQPINDLIFQLWRLWNVI
ncbi:hypothetical protein K443DRAFT_84307 [Laccaria amethystina LaAM-08-1]|uniref:Unplaced genomic scaffold K443scaffold_6, whole genome shotgun sequence n=1 Tax=Laccaria amethystina LaAM-08-1 TaxID=1095629 RepID=A0A0C9XUL0_9AGAR|nr:hypothetical protein K443DRAFT_84307 [Laccaria amethystina LaAM-08-1]